MTLKESKARIDELEEEVFLLKEHNAELRRLLFSAKRERFVTATPPSQGSLFDATPAEAEPETVVVEKKRKKVRKKPIGGGRNKFPGHLRREVEVIDPACGTEGLRKIGSDITERLGYKPPELFLKVVERPRYVRPGDPDSGVMQAPAPPSTIPGGKVDESMLAWVVTEKLQFHTPVHRLVKKLRQLDITFIKANNLNNWLHRSAEALLPMYHLLQEDIIDSGYVQADESHIRVQSRDKPGSTHRGYMWAYYAPVIKAFMLDYREGRGINDAVAVLEGYTGTLQTDGYHVYESLAKSRGFPLVHCNAHARRKFFELEGTNPAIATTALQFYKKLYAIEREARDLAMDGAERLGLRQEMAVPLLREFKQWLLEIYADPKTLPKSKAGGAVKYALKLWEGLEAYAHDGTIEIDNNLVENAIRPLALGRKNYLFAGSHDAATNLAVLYSFIGTCQKNGINSFKYIDWILRMVAANKVTPSAKQWLPHRIDKQNYPNLFL